MTVVFHHPASSPFRGRPAPDAGAEPVGRTLYDDGRLRITRAPLSPRVLNLGGEIDITNSAAVARVLAGAAEEDGGVVADLGGVTFVDLSGLRVLVLPLPPPARRPVRLRNVPPHVRRLLRVMGWRAC